MHLVRCLRRCDVERYCGVLRTLGNLRQQFWQWNSKSGKRSEVKKYGNVVHLPICWTFNYSTTRLFFTCFHLHLLIRSMITLLDALQKKWSDTEKWLTLCNIQRQAYHEGSSTGNACLQLLQHVDLLQILNMVLSCWKWSVTITAITFSATVKVPQFLFLIFFSSGPLAELFCFLPLAIFQFSEKNN